MERDEYGRFVPRQERQTRTSNPSAYGAESQPWRRSASDESSGLCSRTGAVTTLGVVAGAGIGAALMFLLDPDQGRRRRERLAAAAAAAAERSAELAHSAWDTTSDAAIEGAAAAYAATPSGRDVRRGSRRLWDRASSAFGSAAESTRDTTGGWLDSARAHLPEMPHLRRSHRHD